MERKKHIPNLKMKECCLILFQEGKVKDKRHDHGTGTGIFIRFHVFKDI